MYSRMGDIELPVLPDIADLEVPEFPIKSVSLLYQTCSDFPSSNSTFNSQESESEEEEDKEGPRVDRGLDRGFDQQRVEAPQR